MWITAYWSWLRMLLGPGPVVVSLDEARPNDCSSDVLVEQSLKKKHKLIGDQRIVNIYLFSSETSASSLATRSSSAPITVSSSNLQQ